MPKASYRVEANREGLELSIDENFWDETIIDTEGTSNLDLNIATICQEIRAVLYYIATRDKPAQ